MYSSSGALIKRIVDFIVSLFGILLLSPLFLLLMLLVKLFGERGPVFFVQERATLNNRTFKILKFRTMRLGAEQRIRKGASTEKEITSIGAVLRKIHFDDWPQLFNVLKGEMSLVGVRPKPLYELEKLGKQNSAWKERGKVKAGMTSLSNLLLWLPSSGQKILPNSPEGKKVMQEAKNWNFLPADLYYASHCSPKLDTAILLYTFSLVARKILGLKR